MAEIRLDVGVKGDGIIRLLGITDGIVRKRHRVGLARALNHTGAQVVTRTKRELARQAGLPQSKLWSNGRTIGARRASPDNLVFEVISRGKAIQAAEFPHMVYKRPKQGRDSRGRFMAIEKSAKQGVRVKLWQRQHVQRSGFKIEAGVPWGRGVKARAGLYYRKDGTARFANVYGMYGANLNKEMVKDASARAFHEVVAQKLAPRVAHEISRLMGFAG
jgi:hypothetical protein